MQIPIGQNRKRGRPDKTKKALVRQNENNSFSSLSSQTDTSKSDNSSLLENRIVYANKSFRDHDIDDTANDADINLSCEVNIIIANVNDINAQT